MNAVCICFALGAFSEYITVSLPPPSPPHPSPHAESYPPSSLRIRVCCVFIFASTALYSADARTPDSVYGRTTSTRFINASHIFWAEHFDISGSIRYLDYLYSIDHSFSSLAGAPWNLFLSRMCYNRKRFYSLRLLRRPGGETKGAGRRGAVGGRRFCVRRRKKAGSYFTDTVYPESEPAIFVARWLFPSSTDG